MPYGVKHGLKAPGDFGLADLTGLSLSGAAGIISALVLDFSRKGEASALFTLNHWLVQAGDMIGFDRAPLWVVFAGLVAIGAASVFFFQPITRAGAYGQGFGLLAVIMTAIPPDSAGGLYAPSTPSNTSRIENVAFTQAQASTSRRYTIQLTITAPDGFRQEVATMIQNGTLRGRLYNANSGARYDLFRNAGSQMTVDGQTLTILAGVPAIEDSAQLYTRIELAGYKIEEQSATATYGDVLNWNITLESSDVPLFLQRLTQSYWF